MRRLARRVELHDLDPSTFLQLLPIPVSTPGSWGCLREQPRRDLSHTPLHLRPSLLGAGSYETCYLP